MYAFPTWGLYNPYHLLPELEPSIDPRCCSNAPVPFAETTLASCDNTGSAEKPGDWRYGFAVQLKLGDL